MSNRSSVEPFGATLINMSGEFRNDPILFGHLEKLFERFDHLEVEANLAHRKAMQVQADFQVATSESEIAVARARRALFDLVVFGGEHNEDIRREANWANPYRDSNGNIMFMSPATRKDVRTAMQVNARSLHNAAKATGVENKDSAPIEVNLDELEDLFNRGPSIEDDEDEGLPGFDK